MENPFFISDMVFITLFAIGVVGRFCHLESRIIKNAAQRGSVFFVLFASVAMVGILAGIHRTGRPPHLGRQCRRVA